MSKTTVSEWPERAVEIKFNALCSIIILGSNMSETFSFYHQKIEAKNILQVEKFCAVLAIIIIIIKLLINVCSCVLIHFSRSYTILLAPRSPLFIFIDYCVYIVKYRKKLRCCCAEKEPLDRVIAVLSLSRLLISLIQVFSSRRCCCYFSVCSSCCCYT